MNLSRHGLRIKQCVLEKKINSLYGYPTLLLAAAEHTPYVLTEQLSAIAAKIIEQEQLENGFRSNSNKQPRTAENQ